MQKRRSCCARMERHCWVPSTSLCPASTHWWTRQWKTHSWLSRCMKMPGWFTWALVIFIKKLVASVLYQILKWSSTWIVSFQLACNITVVWASIEYVCSCRQDVIEWTLSKASAGIHPGCSRLKKIKNLMKPFQYYSYLYHDVVDAEVSLLAFIQLSWVP